MTDVRLIWVLDIGATLVADLKSGVYKPHHPKVGRLGLSAYKRTSEEHVTLGANWGYRPGCIRSEVCADALDEQEEVALFGGTVESYLADYNFPISSTPSGVAFALLKEEIIRQGLTHDDSIYDWRWIRSTYKGGLSCVVQTWYDDGAVKIDRNSAYPFRMLSPLPAAFTRRSRDIHPDGLYRVRVIIPDMIVPFLQVKTSCGSIAYPIGEVTDTWTGAELLYAEEQGIVIDRVFSGRRATRTLDLSALVQRLLDARANIPAPYNQWCKVAANSLAGLLGKREYISIYKIGEIPSGWEAVPTADLAVDIGTREIFSMSKYSLPGTASHITADTRIDLHRKAVQVGLENCLYFDTDALAFASRAFDRVTDIGSAPGQWKIEKVASTYACDTLRRVRWDHHCAPTEASSGRFLCGRLVAGTWTIPANIRDLCVAELKGKQNENAFLQSRSVEKQNHAQVCGNQQSGASGAAGVCVEEQVPEARCSCVE